MKKQTIKRKAIHAELRKESKTFNGWLKYEVTVKNPDGSTEVIPAYGRDLQDALRRVVHDEKVQKIMPRIMKVPFGTWVILWFLLIGISTIKIMEHQELFGSWVGPMYIGTMIVLTTLTLSISNWFRLRNTEKP
jgi:hypothetical protein